MAKKTTRRRKKTTKKSVTKRSGGARSGSGLNAISTSELAREIERRERGIGKLLRKRDRLQQQLEEVNSEIAAAGGDAGGGGVRRRPRNTTNLADALGEVLKKPMGVTEAAEAVQAAGYKSNAANFRVIVNQTLLKDSRFEKVSRGVYKAKK